MSMKVLLFGVSEFANHGVEAIVRSTMNMLTDRNSFEAILSTAFPDNDKAYNIPGITSYVEYKILKKWTFEWATASFIRLVLSNPSLAGAYVQKDTIMAGREADICLSVGGDNYCYKIPYGLIGITEMLKNKYNKKMVLWGASIDERCLTKEIVKNLKHFDRIVARESITYDTLKKIGFKNICLYPDPAFTLEKRPVQLNSKWKENRTIGINVSPLILKYEKQPVLLEAIVALVEYLASQDYAVALIPHVRSVMSDDMVTIQEVYNRVKDKTNVFIVDERYNAMELKYIISKCRFLLTTRTHASIAAYSTLVPTLVIGYSVKSKGIARDIFGTEQGYVIPIESLQNSNDLTHQFGAFMENESKIRDCLNNTMPSYIEKAQKAAEVIVDLIG